MEAALSRFEAALEQVEASFARLAGARTHDAALMAENDSLRAQQARMEEEMQALRARATELADLNKQAILRMDKAMARIRAVLGEEA